MKKEKEEFEDKNREKNENQGHSDDEKTQLQEKFELDFNRIFSNHKVMNFRKLLKSMFK